MRSRERVREIALNLIREDTGLEGFLFLFIERNCQRSIERFHHSLLISIFYQQKVCLINNKFRKDQLELMGKTTRRFFFTKIFTLEQMIHGGSTEIDLFFNLVLSCKIKIDQW